MKGCLFNHHGSHARNWLSILRVGVLNLSNTRYMTAGACTEDGCGGY